MLRTSLHSKVVLCSRVRGSKDKAEKWYQLSSCPRPALLISPTAGILWIEGPEPGEGLHLPCGRRRWTGEAERCSGPGRPALGRARLGGPRPLLRVRPARPGRNWNSPWKSPQGGLSETRKKGRNPPTIEKRAQKGNKNSAWATTSKQRTAKGTF